MRRMTIAESLLPEFDREMGLTRRVLERVPDGQFAWKPHEKSMTLGRLAEHLMAVSALGEWADIVPVSALSGHQVGLLTDLLVPVDRAQPHLERDGLHHGGIDRVPRLARPHPA